MSRNTPPTQFKAPARIGLLVALLAVFLIVFLVADFFPSKQSPSRYADRPEGSLMASVNPIDALVAADLEQGALVDTPKSALASPTTLSDGQTAEPVLMTGIVVADAIGLYEANRIHEADRLLEARLAAGDTPSQDLFAIAQLLAMRPRDVDYLQWLANALADGLDSRQSEEDPAIARQLAYAFLINKALESQPDSALQLWELAFAAFPDSLEIATEGAQILSHQPQGVERSLRVMSDTVARVMASTDSASQWPKDTRMQAFLANYARMLVSAGDTTAATPYIDWLVSIESNYEDFARGEGL